MVNLPMKMQFVSGRRGERLSWGVDSMSEHSVSVAGKKWPHYNPVIFSGECGGMDRIGRLGL